jgi:hypothetical protein
MQKEFLIHFALKNEGSLRNEDHVAHAPKVKSTVRGLVNLVVRAHDSHAVVVCKRLRSLQNLIYEVAVVKLHSHVDDVTLGVGLLQSVIVYHVDLLLQGDISQNRKAVGRVNTVLHLRASLHLGRWSVSIHKSDF